MSGDNQASATLLERSSRGLALAAANRLLGSHPELESLFGDGAFSSWRDHLEQRVLELSSALLASEPKLFVNAVQWSRVAFVSREVPKEYVRASLESLRDVVAEELPISAGELSREYLEAGLEGLDKGGDEPRLKGDSRTERLALEYLSAALEGNRDRAIALVLDAADDGLPVSDILTEVLARSQREVGTMWHSGEVSVSHEHFVTATTRSVMALLAHRLGRRPRNGKSVMVAVAPGNAHTLGAQILACLFEFEGWRVLHLGESLPAAELGVALAAFDADLLALSIALAPQLQGAKAAVNAARAVRPEIKVLLGGPLLETVPDVWRRAGADGGAVTAEGALNTAAELVGVS